MAQQQQEPDQISSKTQYKNRWYLVFATFFLQFWSLNAFQDFSSNHYYFKLYFSKEEDPESFEFYYNVIYSVSLMLLCYFAIYTGVICDKYGSTLVVLVQWTAMTVGAVVMCLSIYMDIFWLLFIGRCAIFMANSTMWISLGTFLLQYFHPHEQSTPQAIMTTSYMSVFINLNSSPSLVQQYGVLFGCYVVLASSIVCLVISIFLYRLDTRLDKMCNEYKEKKDFKITEFIETFKKYPPVVYYYISQNFLALIVSTIVEIVGPAFLTQYWGKSPEVAGRICALAPLTSVFLVVLGKYADKFQKHTQLMVVSSVLHIVALLCMPLVPIPEISFIIYGFAFSIRMMLTFPIQSLLVPKIESGKTYAVTRASKDVFGFMVAFGNGVIASKYGYAPVVYIQAGVSVLVTIAAVLLHTKYTSMVKNNDSYFKELEIINNPKGIDFKALKEEEDSKI